MGRLLAPSWLGRLLNLSRPLSWWAKRLLIPSSNTFFKLTSSVQQLLVAESRCVVATICGTWSANHFLLRWTPRAEVWGGCWARNKKKTATGDEIDVSSESSSARMADAFVSLWPSKADDTWHVHVLWWRIMAAPESTSFTGVSMGRADCVTKFHRHTCAKTAKIRCNPRWTSNWPPMPDVCDTFPLKAGLWPPRRATLQDKPLTLIN